MINKTILCVDDEPDILENYIKILGSRDQGSDAFNLADRRARRGHKVSETKADPPAASFFEEPYRILTASTGEEAVELVKEETAKGNRVAAGFFDMVLPGIDGLETIKQIRKVDEGILCAVVTAYTDRKLDDIRTVFQNQDEWIYFNKPFTSGELEQTACSLVSLWNRRFMENQYRTMIEDTKEGLIQIIHGSMEMTHIPPMAIDNLLKGIMYTVLGVAQASDGFIILFSPGSREIHQCKGVGEYDNYDISNYSDLLTKPFIDECLKTKKPYIGDQNVSIPLVSNNDVLGIILFKHVLEGLPEVELLELVGLQSVHMIHQSILYQELESNHQALQEQNTKLEKAINKLTDTEKEKDRFESLAMVDELTGVSNRRFGVHRIGEELSRSKRRDLNFAVMIIDLDNFKTINDTYGHLMGDQVLKELAAVFLDQKRIYDLVSRYGGDEFILMFPGENAENAKIISDRLLNAVRTLEFTAGEITFKITITIGVCIYALSDDVKSPEELVKRADQALYTAKKQGKNGACFYSNS